MYTVLMNVENRTNALLQSIFSINKSPGEEPGDLFIRILLENDGAYKIYRNSVKLL